MTLPASGIQPPANRKNITPYIPLLAYVVFVLLAGIIAYYFFWKIEGVLEKEKLHDLGIIAETKAEQITLWRKTHNRMGDAFSHGSLLTEEFDQWLQKGMPSNEYKHRIRRQLDELKYTNGYRTLALLDKQGVTRISTDSSYVMNAKEIELAKQAMKTRMAVFSDFQRSNGINKETSIYLAVPLILTSKKTDSIAGAAVLQINPDTFLYPLLKSWSTRMGSAELLLVRREGGDVMYLNELRHSNIPKLSLHLPINTPNLPAALAVKGETSAINGIDYRGIPVVAAMRKIPDTTWHIVAKADKEELFAPILQLKKWAAYSVFIFTLLGGGLFLVWLRGIQARNNQLKSENDAVLEREMLLKRLEYLTKYASDNILVADTKGHILEANERAQESFGYTCDELLQMRLCDLCNPTEDIAIFNAQLEQLNELSELRYETIIQRKNGTAFPVEIYIRAIEVQGVKYLHSIARDITERKKAEQQLRQQQDFTLQVIDSVPNLIFVTDANGKFLLVSQFMAKLHQLEPDKLIGKADAGQLMNTGPATQHSEMNKEVLETRHPVEFVTHNFIGNQENWLHFTKVPMKQPDGTVYVLNIGVDITERKQAEQILRQQKNFTLQIIDTVPSLVFVTDSKGEFLLVNQTMAAFHGMKPEELIGQVGTESFLIAGQADQHFKSDQEVLKYRHQVQFTAHHIIDGRSYWFHFSKVPMEQPDGTVHILNIGVDITERKQFEEMRADIEHAGRLNIAGEMASGLAHELSQPLTACNNYLVGCMRRMNDNDWNKEKLIKAVQLAQKQAERAGEIVRHLKNMVKKQGHEHTLININLLAKDVMYLLEDEIKNEGISLRMTLLPLPQIMACKIEIEQVLLNLYKNAIESMHACFQRELCVSTRIIENAHILVSVRDSGRGISSEEMNDLFNPFHTSKQDGLGLGLVLCRGFIENHGGRIWVNAQHNAGTEFCFTLPVRINHE